MYICKIYIYIYVYTYMYMYVYMYVHIFRHCWHGFPHLWELAPMLLSERARTIYQRFRRGWMPPHPTVYVKKTIYERLGMYRINIGSGADYECLIRLLVKHEIKVGYIPEILVKMRVGGTSNASFKNRMAANRADRQAWVENDLKPPLGLRFTKPLSKLPQYWRRPLSWWPVSLSP